MNGYEKIQQRYGFALPQAYRDLQSQGRFDCGRVPCDCLEFRECEWLTLDGIAEYQFNRWEIAVDGGFVPFAMTARHEPYCWRLDWGTAAVEPPIVLCERSERATCLAPNFCGFLYRMAVEAFATGSDPGTAAESQSRLLRAVEILANVLPPTWSARLFELRSQSGRSDGITGSSPVLSWEEGQRILQADLSFPRWNETFIHDKDYLKRVRNRA